MHTNISSITLHIPSNNRTLQDVNTTTTALVAWRLMSSSVYLSASLPHKEALRLLPLYLIKTQPFQNKQKQKK